MSEQANEHERTSLVRHLARRREGERTEHTPLGVFVVRPDATVFGRTFNRDWKHGQTVNHPWNRGSLPGIAERGGRGAQRLTLCERFSKANLGKRG